MPAPPAAPPAPPTHPGGRVPLARLFAMGFRSLIDQLHEGLARQGWPEMRPPYGFVLLAARGGPLTAAEVAETLGFSKQAASKVVESMEEVGYVRRRRDEGDGRAKLIEVTPLGHRLLSDVEGLYAELEARWALVVGGDRIESMRDDLVTLLRSENDGRLPPIRPTW